jgi:4-hydroxy-4-methyl-2-oxoglutarate aldolase
MPAENAVIIRRDFPRPPAALVDAFRGVPTGFVVDALGRRGALDPAIRPLFDSGHFVGTALTCWTIPRDNLTPYLALSVAQPGDVLLATNGGATDASITGDLMIGMASNCGVAAVVVDGLARDVTGIIEVGLPVYARGLSPNSPFKNGPGEIGLPIAIGGLAVCSGDIIVGDRDGVVVVPLARAAEVIATLATVKKKEAAMDAAVRGGLKAPDWQAAMLASDRVHYLDQAGA